MTAVRTVIALLAGLVVVVVFFAALVAADDPPTKCLPVPGRAHHAAGILSHDIGPGKLTCGQVRRLLRRWIRAEFPARLDGWRFSYRQDCSCHFARRVIGGATRRFTFT